MGMKFHGGRICWGMVGTCIKSLTWFGESLKPSLSGHSENTKNKTSHTHTPDGGPGPISQPPSLGYWVFRLGPAKWSLVHGTSPSRPSMMDIWGYFATHFFFWRIVLFGVPGCTVHSKRPYHPFFPHNAKTKKGAFPKPWAWVPY